MKMKSLRLIVLLVAAAAAIVAQSIKTGSVKGIITNASTGKSVPHTKVNLLKNGKTISATSTNQQGVFSFSSVSTGTYVLEAIENGCDTFRLANLNIKEGKLSMMNISLKPLLANLKGDSSTTVYDVAEKAEGKKSILPVGCTKISSNRQYSSGEAYSKDKVGYASPVFNTEGYDKIDDNEFREVKANPLSTFSIDVDAASYSNVRRFINQGTLPPKDAVRIEEMINYFTYDYPAPDREHPFSISTEVSSCPWNSKHELIHIGLKGREIATENLPSSNLTFLIDVSGSMDQQNKLPLLKNAFRLLVNQMRANDRVAIVVYAGNAGLVLPSTRGDRKEKILAAIDGLEAGGSTAGGEGIKLAYKTAKENFLENGNNRVILATDGDFNVGVSSDGELTRLIEERRDQGVFLTVLGFGMGNYKDSKMEKLADKGNGNYAYIDNIMEADKVFVKEMGATLFTIAKDVKLQIEFNPAMVKAYRLVGYENRILANEDFNNDKKDAGELGSGHSVTAMYEVISANSEELINSIDPLKYQKMNSVNERKESDELLTVKFRYKEPKENESKLIVKVLHDDHKKINMTSENFRWSAAVAEIGMLLRESAFKGQANFKDAIALARQSKGKDTEGYRAEFIRLAETAELIAKGSSSLEKVEE